MKMNYKIRRILVVILHAGIWIGIVFLANLEGLDLMWGRFSREDGSLIVPLLYGIGLGALIFYVNANFLIPRFLGKSKKRKFWIRSVALLLGISVLEAVIDAVYLILENLELANTQFSSEPAAVIAVWIVDIFLAAFIANLLCWMLSFAFRLPQDWLKAEKQKSILEQDILRSELNFLKAQLNPHFLFNGINSIYHMIGKNDAAAKETLMQFSGLLRYQLYECNEKYIPLNKEFEYISNYLNIEEVRKGEDASFRFNLPDLANRSDLYHLKIAPLLLTPFLENAFKYLSNHSKKEYNFIHLDLEVSDKGILEMSLKNSYEPGHKFPDAQSGGIGLENVKRRLILIYPEENHRLAIHQSENMHTVELMINLNDN